MLPDEGPVPGCFTRDPGVAVLTSLPVVAYPCGTTGSSFRWRVANRTNLSVAGGYNRRVHLVRKATGSVAGEHVQREREIGLVTVAERGSGRR